MRPKKHKATGEGDLFRARLDQIINLKHELVQLAAKIDWAWIDGEIAPLYSDNGRPGIESRFVIGLLMLKHMFGLSDEGVCERWVYDPVLPALHRRDVLPAHLPARALRPQPLAEAPGQQARDRRWPRACGWRTQAARCGPGTWRGSRSTPRCSPRTSPSRPTPSCCTPRSRGSTAWPAGTVCHCANPICGWPSRRR